MEMYGWGNFPKLEAEVTYPLSSSQCVRAIHKIEKMIARGNGRSYGDSGLAAQLIDTRHLNHFIEFDAINGLLRCASGVLLQDIIKNFVPHGWFLPVTPGTAFVTIGGAIASDVHGKNHHCDGTFGNHVTEIELLLGTGERVLTSPSNKQDLFHATCGGMGLTGIILSATLRLKPIKSSKIIETRVKAPDIDAVLEAFAEHDGAPYSVAWIDCLARGKNLGRSVLMLGEHAEDGLLDIAKSSSLSIPFTIPQNVLNHTAVSLFNHFFYVSKPQKQTKQVAMESYFYPLDRVHNWNRLYGKAGFVQYQFVLPLASGVNGLRDILEHIAASRRGSFLAVLKVFGKANNNHLSFPIEGYTLSLDFKVSPDVFLLLMELDKLVLKHGGRLYLPKDARMSEATFRQGYPRCNEFEEVRAKYGAIGKFASAQSKRLGLL